MTKAVLTAVAAIVFAIVTAQPGISGERLMVVTLKASGITCGSCAGAIEKGLKTVDGIAAVKVDVEKGLVYASYDVEKVKPEAVAAKVTTIGYASQVADVSPIDAYPGGQTTGKPGCACCDKKK